MKFLFNFLRKKKQISDIIVSYDGRFSFNKNDFEKCYLFYDNFHNNCHNNCEIRIVLKNKEILRIVYEKYDECLKAMKKTFENFDKGEYIYSYVFVIVLKRAQFIKHRISGGSYSRILRITVKNYNEEQKEQELIYLYKNIDLAIKSIQSFIKQL